MGDRCQAPLRFLPDMVAPGHQQLRFHSVTPASGASFHAWFREQLIRSPSILFNRQLPVIEFRGDHFLLTLAEPGGLAQRQLQVPQLLLAGGGFAADPEMVAEFIPDADTRQSSAPSSARIFSSAARVVGLPYRPYS